MQKEDVVRSVIKILRRANWEHSVSAGTCFDVLGRGEEASVLFKVHSNIDSATRETAEEMKKAAMYLSAAPLIVGERNSRDELERQVIYERYGVPTVKPETLESYLRLRESSVVMNKKGGYYVSLDSEKIEERRKEEGYSVNGLAKEIGVSRKTINNYRNNGMATVEKAQRLEETLGDVLQEIDIFRSELHVEQTSTLTTPVTEHMISLGFEAAGFRRAPFDVAAKDEQDRYVAKQDEQQLDEPTITALQLLRQVMESKPFVVSEERSSYGDVPAVSQQELRRMDHKDDLKAALY